MPLSVFSIIEEPSWSWSYGSWIYNYLCNQYLSQLKLCVRVLLMAWNTRYSKMWWNLAVTYDRYSGFLHQLKWPPRYNWNIVENDLRHHNPNTNTLFIDKSVIEHKTWLLIQFLLQGHAYHTNSSIAQPVSSVWGYLIEPGHTNVVVVWKKVGNSNICIYRQNAIKLTN